MVTERGRLVTQASQPRKVNHEKGSCRRSSRTDRSLRHSCRRHTGRGVPRAEASMPQTSFTTMPANDTYHGAHRLDHSQHSSTSAGDAHHCDDRAGDESTANDCLDHAAKHRAADDNAACVDS